MNTTNNQFLENIKFALDRLAIVAVTDPQGHIVSVNQRFIDISGYSEAELIGSNHRILNSKEHDTEFFKNMWETISSGNIWSGEIKNRRKNGTHYWVDTSIVPVVGELGQIIHYVSIRYEITEKKEIESNLDNLIESSNDGIIIYDLNGNIIWTNQVFIKFFGQDFNKKNLQVIIKDSGQLFVLGETKINFDIQNERKTFEMNTKNYFYRGHASFLVVLRDITDKVKIESQMMYQDRLATVGLLASGVAHEVGTPLGVMRGRAEMMRSKLQDAGFLEKNLEIFIQQIDRISKLVKSLLEVSRGSTSSPAQFNPIGKTVDDLILFISHELMKNNVKIFTKGFEKDALGFFNSSQLFQALLNLAMNSIYVLNEKNKIVKVFQPTIQIQLSEEKQFFVLDFFDNGCGIQEQNLKNIFSPFYTTKPLGQGTGLGLATSYRNVEAWGGKMQVESQIDEWTRFKLFLKKS